MKKNAVYIQSGGPTSVINSSAFGVIDELMKNQNEIGRVFASENGILGLINERLFELSLEENLELLLKTPSMAFGSCRHKLLKEDYKKVFDTLKKFDIGYIFINGGNGSVRAAKLLNDYLLECGYLFKLIVIPKTVDNDIYLLDHAPGFASAARHVVISVSELLRDMHTYDTDLIMFAEVMGRNTGFLAAAALAVNKTGIGPDLIYVPEVIFDENRFILDVKRVIEEKGKCFAVVAEGVKNKDGKYLFEMTTVNSSNDPSLNMGGITPYLSALLRKNFNCKIRGIDLGLMQRCAIHDASSLDLWEARELGRMAVKEAINNKSGVMVAFKRINDRPYESSPVLLELGEIEKSDNTLPLKYITKDNNYIKDDYLDFILPLIGEIPHFVGLKKKIAKP